MNSNSKLPLALAAMLVAVGVFKLGGIDVMVFTPQPATRSMLELRDAGILDGQPVVIECPERLTAQTKRRINNAQPGLLRPKQSYAHVARTARCFGDKYLDGGFGNCIRPSDGVTLAPFTEEVVEYRFTSLDGGREWHPTPVLPILLDDGGVPTADLRADGGYFERIGTTPRDSEVIIPSLRRNLVGVDLDASVADDGGDSDAVDDSLQYRNDACEVYGCAQYDDLIDAGLRPNPFANRYCNALNRLSLVPSPCMIPDGRLADGGWLDDAPEGVIDCRFTGPYGTMDGGPRWRGVNVGPREFAVGSQCLPVECSVVSGDVPQEWL